MMTDDIKELIAGRPFFCSWSGGKDSCLALYHALQNGGKARSLISESIRRESWENITQLSRMVRSSRRPWKSSRQMNSAMMGTGS